jgi:signal transduction histidine kinase
VVDDGRASPGSSPAGAGTGDGTGEVTGDMTGGAAPGRRRGLGQLGMRERVAMHGGVLDVGPRPGGGYRVRARFQLQAAVAVGR